ncbi:TraB/VirB10 family protein [Parasutterella sp.]|uniref:TraB/VirB10 family protein n=1 Tax=Parasutterella sp. TaxID=2049037 RepID=UPI00399557A1
MSVKSYFESERRKKQITWTLIILGALFIGAMLSSYYSDDKKPPSVPQTTSTTQISMVPSKADYEQHQAIYNDRLLNLERESKEAKQREAKLQSAKKRLEDRIALLEKNAPRTNRQSDAAPSEDGWPPSEILGKQPISQKTGFTSGNQNQGRYSRQQPDAPVSSPAPRLVINNFGSAPTSSNVLGTLPARAKPETLSYLPSGTFAKARLLNGATAPTRGQGSGNPVPVLLELTDSAVMPNLYRSGIKRCFVTANATGELASERVLIRLDRLSCIDENGGAVDKKIQGYVSGEDGKTVFELAWLPRADSLLRILCFIGTLAGWAKPCLSRQRIKRLPIRTVSTTVTNPWKAGFGEGATHAMDRITDYYLKLASDMFPVLEVDSGRSVEIVISNGISIERNTKP